MTITRTSSPVSGSLEGLTDRGRHHSLRWALLIGIAVLVVAVVAGWLLINSHVALLPALRPCCGDQPVRRGWQRLPRAGPCAGDGTAVTNPYAEGGSVYSEQVPAQARYCGPPVRRGWQRLPRAGAVRRDGQ